MHFCRRHLGRSRFLCHGQQTTGAGAQVLSKPNKILHDIQDSAAYAHLLEKPGGWVAPSAVAPLSPITDGLPGNDSAATSAEGLGKGGKGGKGASTKKNLKETAARRGKGLKGTGASDSEDA